MRKDSSDTARTDRAPGIQDPIRASCVYLGSPDRAARISASIWPDAPLEDRLKFEALIARYGIARDASGRPIPAKRTSGPLASRLARDPISGRRVSDVDGFAGRRYGLTRQQLMSMFRMDDVDLPSRPVMPPGTSAPWTSQSPEPLGPATQPPSVPESQALARKVV